MDGANIWRKREGKGRGREELTCNEDGGLLKFMFQKGMLIREDGLRGKSRR